MNLLYRGSVKDIYKDNDSLLFKYSNRYSIFDWGEMPNDIPQKGEALAAMAAYFFEYLKNQGIKSHYLGFLGADTIKVKEVAVLRPQWENGSYDYSIYEDRPTECLVPLEVIFRYYLGQGNSLTSRLQKNQSYLADLGLSKVPGNDEKLDPALVEFSTKLESTDRYLTAAEIRQLNVISGVEISELRKETQKIAGHLEKLFASFGVKLWDGKFEFAFTGSSAERNFYLVDSIGPDELRLTYEGQPLSKEFLRQLYHNTPWLEAVKRAKDLAKERGTIHWKEICVKELNQSPQVLTKKQLEVASLLYKSLANEVAKVMEKPLPFEGSANLKNWRQQCESL